MAGRVLVVDDNAVFARSLLRTLERSGIAASWVNHASRVPQLLSEGEFDAAVVEAVLPGTSGLRILELIRAQSPRTRVVMVAATSTLEAAVEAMKSGAVDFKVKPLSPELLAEQLRVLVGSEAPRAEGGDAPTGAMLLGESEPMARIRGLVARVASTDAAVLITGESGTGKELLARAIHEASARRGRLFLAVNCGAVSETLIDSELFGHVRGAFTGARSARRGLFEEASGGTILLDEIASTSGPFQARLLRVLEDGQVRPVGSAASLKTDVRVIASSNVDLREQVAAGRFRADLYFRLNVVSIELPALRERGADLEQLALHFARLAAATLGRAEPRLGSGAMETLAAHSWPGNVRELRHVIERAMLLGEGAVIERAHLALHPVPVGMPQADLPVSYAAAKRAAIEQFSRSYLAALLARHGGNVSRAARAAGMPRQTLHRLLRQLALVSR